MTKHGTVSRHRLNSSTTTENPTRHDLVTWPTENVFFSDPLGSEPRENLSILKWGPATAKIPFPKILSSFWVCSSPGSTPSGSTLALPTGVFFCFSILAIFFAFFCVFVFLLFRRFFTFCRKPLPKNVFFFRCANLSRQTPTPPKDILNPLPQPRRLCRRRAQRLRSGPLRWSRFRSAPGSTRCCRGGSERKGPAPNPPFQRLLKSKVTHVRHTLAVVFVICYFLQLTTSLYFTHAHWIIFFCHFTCFSWNLRNRKPFWNPRSRIC